VLVALGVFVDVALPQPLKRHPLLLQLGDHLGEPGGQLLVARAVLFDLPLIQVLQKRAIGNLLHLGVGKPARSESLKRPGHHGSGNPQSTGDLPFAEVVGVAVADDVSNLVHSRSPPSHLFSFPSRGKENIATRPWRDWMEWGFRAEPKTGSFPAEGWLFIIGTLALSERNGG